MENLKIFILEGAVGIFMGESIRLLRWKIPLSEQRELLRDLAREVLCGEGLFYSRRHFADRICIYREGTGLDEALISVVGIVAA